MKVKNVSPLGELDVLLLGRTVAAGEVVEVTTKQAAEMVATGNFEKIKEA